MGLRLVRLQCNASFWREGNGNGRKQLIWADRSANGIVPLATSRLIEGNNLGMPMPPEVVHNKSLARCAWSYWLGAERSA